MTPEGAIKRQICDWLQAKKHFYWMQMNVGIAGRKFNSPHAKKGVSDILGIWRGKMIAIEVKAPGGKLSDDQKLFLGLVREHGGHGFVAFSLDDVIKEMS